MPIRRFDGTDDFISCAVGDTDQPNDWSIAALVRPSAIGDAVIAAGHDSVGDPQGYSFGTDTNGRLGAGAPFPEFSTSSDLLKRDVWGLVGASIDDVDGLARFHSFPYDTRTWAHEDAPRSIGSAASFAGGRYRIGQFLNLAFWPGDMAAIAVWASKLSDSDYESLEAAASLSDWARIRSPVALMLFDQASVRDPLLDLIGAADQTSITGTTVVAEDPPIPYTGGGGGPGPVTSILAAPIINVGGVATPAAVFQNVGGVATRVPRVRMGQDAE